MKRKAITDGGQPSKKTEKEPGICKAIGEFAQMFVLMLVVRLLTLWLTIHV